MNTSHFVLGNSMVEPWPDSTQVAIFGLGCFWGAERKFWQLEGVYTTAVGYSGGEKLNPTYREVCNGAVYFTNTDQQSAAIATRDIFQQRLTQAGFGKITTEIKQSAEFYYAEEYHQQYLAKNPSGYCGIGGTGVTCPVGVTR